MNSGVKHLGLRGLYKGLGVVVMCLLVAGCSKPPPPKPVTLPAPPPGPAAPPTPPTEQMRVIYVPAVVKGEQKVRIEKIRIPKGAPPYEPVNKLLDASVDGKRVYPKGTRVFKITDDGKGHVTLLLTKQIRDYTGGTSEEAAAVNALVLTVEETYPGTKSVMIAAEDGGLETLGGASDLTIPQIPDRTMVAIPR